MSVYGKQQSALLFCATSVPSVMLLAKLGWIWALAATLFGALLFCLHRQIPKAALVWNFIALGASADLLCSAFEQGNELLGLLLLLLAAYAAGRDVMPRVGAVAFFFLLILYCMLIGFSLPSVDLSPQGRTPAWYLLAAALTPMLFAGQEGKWPIAGFVVLSVLAALVSSGCADFYTAMKSASILGVMQRLEPLVSVALTIGGFCLLGSICKVNRQLLGTADRWNVPINFLLGGVGIWISRLLGPEILAIGTAIFWGLLPLVPQSLEIQKKFKKKQKNA